MSRNIILLLTVLLIGTVMLVSMPTKQIATIDLSDKIISQAPTRINRNSNDWIIEKGLHSDTLVLSRLDSNSAETNWVISFLPDQKIKTWTYNPKPSCGNGMLFFHDSLCNWQMTPDHQKITLKLDGYHAVSEDFSERIEYSINHSFQDKLILVRSKVYAEKHTPYLRN